jgi:hypothetical protein
MKYGFLPLVCLLGFAGAAHAKENIIADMSVNMSVNNGAVWARFVAGLVTTSNTTYAVSGNAITVPVPSVGDNDVFEIQLTPGTGGGGGTSRYVDYATGSDSNPGTRASPWKYAPGMAACASKCASTTINPGDSVILKGGITWHNESFSWIFPYSGTSGNPIYVGVDPTWFTGGSWSRPIMNLDNAPPTDGLYRIMCIGGTCNGGVVHDVTYDNFEWTNIAALQNSNPGSATTTVFAWPGNGNVVVEHMYVHGWHNPCYTFGTGTLTAGSNTIKNFVPATGSPSPNTTWGSSGSGACKGVYLQAGNDVIPPGNNSPTVTSVSGTGPYTVTFFNTGACGGNGPACWAQSKGKQFVAFGSDNLLITSGADSPSPAGEMMYQNVIDGSDVDIALINPWSDCGLSEGNNNLCRASGTVAWRTPSVWRQNVVRYVYQVAVAQCKDWDGNLIENIRFAANPTAHTNVVECVADDAPNNQTYFYNNVVRHATNPNPHTPDGRWSIGLGLWAPVLNPRETDYVFNNVMYDGIQNDPIEPSPATGTMVVFNNTMNCGPNWSLTFECGGVPVVASNRYFNNHFISAPSGGHYLRNDNGSGNACRGYACTNNIATTPAAATSGGYTTAQTYVYSPLTSGSRTIASGTSISSTCAGILDAVAAAACLRDTTYGVAYDAANHTVTGPARASVARSNPPSVGAYESGGSPPALTPAYGKPRIK